MKIKAISRLFVPETDSNPERYVESGDTLEVSKEKADILINMGAAEEVRTAPAASKKEGA